ncbi:hypothetical protein Cgig2_034056 [Carnegiea gigantea]|uniref:Uncharacterized protein n=1 Tax=Carnegiea gigantea TaxID=171969 RepID=A0A9Q1KI57_9CARY|nr:hypothetical protein Cgig2_034056 [Carnegiea gigantea]
MGVDGATVKEGYNDVIAVCLVVRRKEATVVKDSVLTYHWGSSDCILVKVNMGVGDVMKVVGETMGEGLRERRLWYSTKFDQNMIMPLQRDGDVVKLVKGNDTFSYMYVAEKEGLIQRPIQENTILGAGELKGTCTVCENDHAIWNDGRRSGMGIMAGISVVRVEYDDVPIKFTGFNTDMLDIESRMENSVGCRIENKLKRELEGTKSVIDVQLYNRVSSENNGPTQVTCYMNVVHRMEMHDIEFVDNRTGRVAGGESLNEDYNRRILPPLNPCKRGRPQSKRRES